ncbi:MAG: phosphoesterase [Fuerstiella sp.]|nr:phosphoesterase [Fuerstiella sp.]
MSQTHTAVEHVLVIPTSVFHEIGHFQGFCSDTDRYLDVILDPAYASYRPRPDMEEDPSFKQLIPYCIFQYDDQVFEYRRGNGQGEARLHAKRSVGVGGHVSTVDVGGDRTPYLEGMKREIEEEVDLQGGWTESCVGLINDDESDVGKVHLGIVHIFNLDKPKVVPREQSMIDAGFAPPERLAGELEEFETWSQICLKHLYGC